MRAIVNNGLFFGGLVLGCLVWGTPSAQAVLVEGCVAAPSCGGTASDSCCTSGSLCSGICSCDTCSMGCDAACDPYCRLIPPYGRLKVYGWLNAGFIGNTGSPGSRFNGPYNAVDRANELMFNQGYLVTEAGLPTDGSLGLGGRVDLLYGEDYFLAQSTGFETRTDRSPHWNGHEYYGLAIPQAYVEAGWSDLSLKLGHFYAPIGYEGVPAPDNFFYSKAYSYQFARPFTYWGGLLTWQVNPRWEAQVGLHNGWDSFDRVSDRMGLLAGVKYTQPCNRWWSSFAITTGDDFNNPADLPGIAPDLTNRTGYSWVILLSLTERLDYVFHHWLGFQDDGAIDGGRADWYGIDHYVYHVINDCWTCGIRYEWFRDEDGTRIGLNRPSNPNNPPLPGDIYSIALGLNWTPQTNVMIRPELRWDWFDGDTPRRPFQDGDSDSQLMIGLDAILHF